MLLIPHLISVVASADSKLALPLVPGATSIQVVNKKNFHANVQSAQVNQCVVTWMYWPDSEADKKFLNTFSELASKVKDIFKIGGVNCAQEKELCKDYTKGDEPVVVIRPVFPRPSFNLSAPFTLPAIMGKLRQQLIFNVTELNDSEHVNWYESEPSRPTVLFFYDGKVPELIKFASSHYIYSRTIRFAAVHKSNRKIVAKYKVTKYPTAIIHSSQHRDVYTGAFTLSPFLAWVNTVSESGNGVRKEKQKGVEKVWLRQEVPELSGPSFPDVCGTSAAFCVILVTNNDELNNKQLEMMKTVKKVPSERIPVKVMWLNRNKDKSVADKLAPDTSSEDVALILNPKRQRTSPLTGELNTINLVNHVKKCLTGDGRFSALDLSKQNTLPFEIRQEL